MRKTIESFLHRPDDPPVSGSPLVGEEPIVETPAEEEAEEAPAVEEPPKMTKAEWDAQNPQKPVLQVHTPGQVEMIEGTDLPKPEGYDGWGIDKQMRHIAQASAWQATQSTQAASRVAREIEKSAEDWYKPYLDEVIESCNPMWLAQANDDEKEGLLVLAIGKAVKDGKSPTSNSKPVPGSSPGSTRTTDRSAPSSEVDQVIKGIRDAGYDRVANSPKIRAILEGKAS